MFSKNGMDLEEGSRCLRGANEGADGAGVAAAEGTGDALAVRAFLTGLEVVVAGAASIASGAWERAWSSLAGVSLAMMKPLKVMKKSPRKVSVGESTYWGGQRSGFMLGIGSVAATSKNTGKERVSKIRRKGVDNDLGAANIHASIELCA